jgi:uncharacterized repeat protein (TIGR02543 family)
VYDFGAGLDLYAIWASDYHTVTFAENDSSLDNVVATQTENEATSLTSFSTLAPQFTDAGHTFLDWNTQPDGSGTSYSNGESYVFGTAVVLYAVWLSMPVATASFDAHSGAGSISSINDPVGTSVSLPSSGGFSNPGYVFAGWNTVANGSGTAYVSGATFILNADQIFYAQWAPNQYVVTFVPDGGSVNPNSSIYVYGSPALTLPTPTSANFVFDGWYSESSGGILVGSAGSMYAPGQSTSLYAQWTPVPVITLSFDASGGSGSLQSLGGTTGALVTLPSSSSMVKSGYTLTSWNTSANGSGASYSPGQSVTLTTSTTLYAQWTPVPVITLSFDASGGTGSPASLSGTSGASVTLPGSSSVYQTGYTLTSWNTAANGSGASYALGQSETLTTSTTLYAQWIPVPVITLSFDASGGTGTLASMSGPPGDAMTLPSSSSLEKSGYTMASWNTAADGSGASYAPGQGVTLSTSLTLYAQWKSVPEIMLHFVSDGGSGSLTTLSGLLGATVALPGPSSLVKSGYTLKSWNSAANGSGTSYALGQNVTLTTSLTLYARWTGAPTAVLYGAVGLFAKNATQLSTAMKSQVRQLAVAIRAKGYKKVSLFGYTAETGLSSLDLLLSSARATSVANYLREQLSALKVKGVVILAAGEGAIARMRAHQYSRVEVFVL